MKKKTTISIKQRNNTILFLTIGVILAYVVLLGIIIKYLI